MTDSEVAEVSARLSTRDRALFLLGVRSGFRVSELLSLTVGDVLHRGRVVDRVTVRRAAMKRKLEGRSVVLHAQAKSALADWLKELDYSVLGDACFVFKSRAGTNAAVSRIQAYRALADAYESLGLEGDLGTHTMRKTFANRVYKKLKGDLIQTQRALGHRNVNSTVSYLSFDQGAVDAAILAD